MVKNLTSRNQQNITLPSFSLALTIILCCVVAILRANSLFSLSEPLHIITSGSEEESLYALWKYLHFEPIYQDPHKIPFAASYFNYLFYGFYGEILHFLKKWVVFEDAWLPTLGRFITTCLVLMGYVATVVWYQHISQKKSWILTLSFSTLLFWGPLIGFWAFTVRPDAGAFVFEILGVIAYFAFATKRPVLSILLFVMGCYFAWGFKQINITFPLAMSLFLLLKKDWKSLSLFCIAFFIPVASTLLLASNEMKQAIFFVNTTLEFNLKVGIHNFLLFIGKSLPIWIILLLTPFFRAKEQSIDWKNPIIQFCLCGLIVWLVTLVPASAKVGSADNYHFCALFFGSTLALLFIDQAIFGTRMTSRVVGFAFLSFCGLFMYAIFFQATISLKPQHLYYQKLKNCIQPLPAPLFSSNLYLALPWMHPSKKHFVLAYNYAFDRARSLQYEQNGVGGLINQGYFASLVLPKDTKNEYDGVSLDNYALKSACGDYQVYLRKEPIPNNRNEGLTS